MLFCSFNEGSETDNFHLFLNHLFKQLQSDQTAQSVVFRARKRHSERTSVLSKHQSTEQWQKRTKGDTLNDRQVNDKSFRGRFKCLALHRKCNQRKMQAAK